MRPSPLRHSLAVLRTTLKITQKEMADLVNRAPRTIQAVELGQLPLSEELAREIADATGIDPGWLLENDPEVPPRKGLTASQMGMGIGEYTLLDFEFHRAFIESPVATPEQMEAMARTAQATEVASDALFTISLPVFKAALLARKQQMLESQDGETVALLRHLLEKTSTAKNGDIIRWKVRKFLQALASENSVKINLKSTSNMALAQVHVAEEEASGKRDTKTEA